MEAQRPSDSLAALRADVEERGRADVSALAEVLPQYVQDHNDREAWRDVDRQVNRCSRQWARIIRAIEKAEKAVRAIEDEMAIEGATWDEPSAAREGA